MRTVDTIEANSGHNSVPAVCGSRDIPHHARESAGLCDAHCVPQAIVMLAENALCLKYGIDNSLTPRSNVLFRPLVSVGELFDLVRQDHTRPTGHTIS